MKKFILCTLLLSSVAIIATSCSNDTGDRDTVVDETETEEKTEKVNALINEADPLDIGLMASIDALPILYADEMGLFKDNGVNINVQTFFSAKDRDIAYLGGELDGLTTDLIGLSTLYAAEKPAKIITSTTAEFGLAVTEDSSIETVADMEGKEFLYFKHSVVDYSIDKILETASLSEDDITKTVVPALPLRVEMLLKNEADATLLPEPFMTVARVGGANIIIKTSDLGLNMIAFNIDTNYLENNEAVVEPLLTAYDQAVEDLNAMSEEEFNDYIFNKFKYDGSLRGEITRMHYRPSGLPSEEQFNDAFNWSLERDIISEPISYETANYIN